jgi:catechol 2,3-dioxygenase-like lactoylglutathione lyase family enzyme
MALNPNFMLLYVENPKASESFYKTLLGRDPVQTSPLFVMFALDKGVMLGLWSRDDAKPAPIGSVGGGEIGIAVDGPAAVDSTHAAWTGRGIKIAQPPTDMNFGRTFVGLDPDGHRLRVFAPAPR